MYRLILTFLFSAFAMQVSGQYYISGQEPSWLKWQQLNTPSNKIIYPSGLDSLANTFAQYLNFAREVVPISLNHQPKNFTVIIHGNSILSNGFVTWAPKRMEIVSTPALDSSPESWLHSLALHETRHIVQIDKLNQGFFRVGSFIFGEQSVGAAAGLVPKWFLEGDAVYTETEYTLGGRGRQASFYQKYRTHLLSNNGSKYSYDKWLLGSYKNFVPNHYNFGYQMVGYANLKYGSNVWSNALSYVSRKPYSIFPFYFSLKRDIGLSRKGLFNDAIHYADSLWRYSEVKDDIKNYIPLINNTIKNNFIEYKYPFLINDTTLIALKTSLNKTPKLISVDIKSEKETIVLNPGYITHRLTYSSDAIYWSQYSAHPRWEYLNYSEVWRYDIVKKSAEKLTSKTRYFNPVELDPNTIAVVENTPEGKNNISILSIKGEKEYSILIPSSLELKEICPDGNFGIIARCSSPRGSLIIHYKNFNCLPDTILGPVFRDIANLAYSKGKLFFTMTMNYKEEIFELDISNQQLYKISNSYFGLSDISINSNNQCISSLIVDSGSLPVIVSLDNKESIILEKNTDPLYPSSVDLENFELINNKKNSQNTVLKSINYSKFKNLLHFHSWAPVYYNPTEIISSNEFQVFPGVTIISQNLTSTLVSSFGYSYNQTHGFHAYTEFMGWYPKFMLGVDVGNEYGVINGGPLSQGNFAFQDNPKIDAKGRIRIPYIISSGYFSSELNIGFRFSINNSKTWDYLNENYINWRTNTEPYISFFALTRMAHRDLRPRYGIYLYAGEVSSPVTNNLLGNSLFTKSGIYLPGIFSNHSLLLTGQFENQNLKQYLRSTRAILPRGFNLFRIEKILVGNIDYAFPIAYPDVSMGSIVYLKRIFANVFSDNARVNIFEINQENNWSLVEKTIQSAGIEITADLHFFRTPYLFRLGYQSGINLNDKSYFQNFTFSLDFSSIYGYLSNSQFIKLNL